MILEAAIYAAEVHGYKKLTFAMVARCAKVDRRTVARYFRSKERLQEAVVIRAICSDNLKIIAQLLTKPEQIKQAALACI